MFKVSHYKKWTPLIKSAMGIKHVPVVHKHIGELCNKILNFGILGMLCEYYYLTFKDLKSISINSQKSTWYRAFISKKSVYFHEIPGPQNRTKLGNYMPEELSCLGSSQLATGHWTWIQPLLCYTHCTFKNVKE